MKPDRSYSPRVLWACDKLLSNQGLDGRRIVDTEREAILVSSLTASGLHAPAWDFDFPIRVRNTATTTWLDFDKMPASRPVEFQHVQELLDAADLATPSLPGGGPFNFRLGIEFHAPVRLVTSSNREHCHVYVDAELEWSTYREICEAMRDASMLENGFVENSIIRGMTMLLKPGLTKADLVSMGIEIEGYLTDKKGEDDSQGDDSEAAF